jgi:hypothetical protein
MYPAQFITQAAALVLMPQLHNALVDTAAVEMVHSLVQAELTDQLTQAAAQAAAVLAAVAHLQAVQESLLLGGQHESLGRN